MLCGPSSTTGPTGSGKSTGSRRRSRSASGPARTACWIVADVGGQTGALSGACPSKREGAVSRALSGVHDAFGFLAGGRGAVAARGLVDRAARADDLRVVVALLVRQ